MKEKKIKVIISALALTTLLNSCSLKDLGKKNNNMDVDATSISDLNCDMSVEDALMILESNQTISFFFNKDLTCPIEIDKESNTYRWKNGYSLYYVDDDVTHASIMNITKDNDYILANVDYMPKQNDETEGVIGVKDEYLYLIKVVNTVLDLVQQRNANLTKELVKKENNFYLVPNGYELYSFNKDIEAFLVEETEEGLVYAINDNDILNFVAIVPKINTLIKNGNLLKNCIANIYNEQNKQLTL